MLSLPRKEAGDSTQETLRTSEFPAAQVPELAPLLDLAPFCSTPPRQHAADLFAGMLSWVCLEGREPPCGGKERSPRDVCCMGGSARVACGVRAD